MNKPPKTIIIDFKKINEQASEVLTPFNFKKFQEEFAKDYIVYY